jgi:hypothetical protein
MTDSTLNHDKTKALLIHATAASSTKEVAELIGAASSRISEGKDKRWRLPVESAGILIEAFGPARAEQGDYFEVEVWNSFDEYKKKSPVIVAKRQLVKIADILNDDVGIEHFLYSIDLIDTSIGYGRESLELKLSIVNKLIYHPTFIKWYKFLKRQTSIQRHLGSSFGRLYYVNVDRLLEKGIDENIRYHMDNFGAVSAESSGEVGSLKALLKDFGIKCIHGFINNEDSKPFTSLLYLIGEFTENYEWISELFNLPIPAEKYLLGMKFSFSEPIRHKSVILTGDVIWNEKCQATDESKPANSLVLLSKDVIGGVSTSDHYDDFTHDYMYQDIYFGSDKAAVVNVQLNLAKSMAYHLHFRLGELNESDVSYTSKSRSIIIKDIRADDVFDVINDFADYFKLRYVPMIEIKQMIAKNGGFIPGAMYLE